MKNCNQRTLNVMFQKAGSGSISTRLSLPKDWINAMGITPDSRQVTATFDEETKIIHIWYEKQE